MTNNFKTLIIGRRASGKTILVDSMLQSLDMVNKAKEKHLTIFSEIERFNQIYSRKYTNSNIFYEYDETIIKNIIVEQQMGTSRDHKVIVIDDCLPYKGKWLNILTDLFEINDALNISIIVTVQYAPHIRQGLCQSFDYVFLFKDELERTKKHFYDHYCGIFPDYKSFDACFVELTKDYGTMVICKTGTSNILLDNVFYYNSTN